MTALLGTLGDKRLSANIQAYVSQRADIIPDWFPLLPFEPASERGSAFLLFAAALKGLIPESKMGDFLLLLWDRFGIQIFRLSHRPYEDLTAFLSGVEGLPESSLIRIPGVLRSVTDFFFREGSVLRFLARLKHFEEGVNQLAESLFWMGKNSEYRNKPRYFFWLCERVHLLPAHLSEAGFPPVSMGVSRFVYEFGTLATKKKWKAALPDHKLRLGAAMAKEISPHSAWNAVLPLDEFLERRGPNAFACQQVRQGCGNCPLQRHCSIGKGMKI